MKAFILFIVTFALHFNLSAADYYTVKFPNDTTVYGCGASIPSSYPTINHYGSCNFGVGVSVQDQVFYSLGTQSCGKVLRRFRLVYWCDYNPNWFGPSIVYNPTNSDLGPTVIGNSYNHGYIEYTQVIKFLDNVPPVFINCPTGTVTVCDYTNNDPNQYHTNHVDLCEAPVDLSVKVTDVCSKSNVCLSYRLFLDLDGNGSMETFKSSSDSLAWPVEKTILNDTVRARIKFPTGFGLPYGKHKVEWIASDNCGNQTVCKYEILVKDCKAPTVVCINGLSVNIMQTGMITLWASDFLQYTFDNCTPSDQIKIGVRKAGTGTGFPNNSSGVTFDCTELGTQYVEIWAVDGYGNADYCQTYVVVQDHSGTCNNTQTNPPTTTTIALTGTVNNDQQQKIAGVKMRVSTVPPATAANWDAVTDANGKYAFAAIPACNTVLAPLADPTFKHNGITTMDVLLAANLMAGAYTPTSPYRIMAADANLDNQLNDNDLIEMINSIVAPVNPGSAGWRYVPRSHIFPDPAHPFAAPIPDRITVTCPQTVLANTDFVGIAIGDLDGSVQGNHLTAADDRAEGEAVFTAANQSFRAGETVQVDITTPDLDALVGFQFTMGFDTNILALQTVEPGLVPLSWMGIFGDEGKISASWHTLLSEKTAGKNQKTTAFTLFFTALQAGKLADVLQMNADLVKMEAYTSDYQTIQTALAIGRGRTLNRTENSNSNTFSAAQPNPSNGTAKVNFTLVQDEEVRFTMTDISGRIFSSTHTFLLAGTHEYMINRKESGVVLLRIDHSGGSEFQRILINR